MLGATAPKVTYSARKEKAMKKITKIACSMGVACAVALGTAGMAMPAFATTDA